MKVALVHDDLVQWGGAERVLSGLSEIYPDAPIYTSVYDSTNPVLMQKFAKKKVITSFLQKVPGWKQLYKTLLPFYSLAFEQFVFDEYDLVISQTTRFAKSIITKPSTLHICYCHTPPRFLWRFSGEGSYGLGEILMTKLRIFDSVAARRVDYFLAGSQNAQRRIKKIYRAQSKVVYPFVDFDRFSDVAGFDGGYFLAIGRANKYKRYDLPQAACQKLGVPLKIIGSIKDNGRVGKLSGVEFLSDLDDETVVRVLAGCRALIIAGIEDFGLTSLEAQALGKPVVAFAAGGVLETVIPDRTGIFFYTQTVDGLADALQKLESVRINPRDCKANATRFSKENFLKNFKQTVATLVYTNT